jgi:hypothetical protein
MMRIASIIILIASTTQSFAQGPQPLGSDAKAAFVDLASVSVVQNWVADGDAGQCNAGAYNQFSTPGGSYSQPIRMDTDNRPGGCQYQIGILDPRNVLASKNFKLQLGFFADGDPGQCGGIGTQDVPVSRNRIVLTTPIRVDTDNRPGACIQRWSLQATDIVLDISWTSDGDPGQCGNQGAPHTVQNGYVDLRLDMDNRPGGCWQSLRLRALKVPHNQVFEEDVLR